MALRDISNAIFSRRGAAASVAALTLVFSAAEANAQARIERVPVSSLETGAAPSRATISRVPISSLERDAPSRSSASVPVTADSGVSIGAAILKSKEGVVVLHYGPGIRDADNAVDVLGAHGIRAIALPGGKPNDIAVFINGMPRGHYNDGNVDILTIDVERRVRPELASYEPGR